MNTTELVEELVDWLPNVIKVMFLLSETGRCSSSAMVVLIKLFSEPESNKIVALSCFWVDGLITVD